MAPLRLFAFRKIDVLSAGKRDRRVAVSLRAEQRVVAVRILGHRFQEAIFAKFGERLGPVVADRSSLLADIANQRGQVGQQVIAAPFSELVEEVVGPV